MQLFVNALYIFERERFEPLEQGVRLFVTAFDFEKIFARLAFHFLVRLVIETHIQFIDCMNPAAFDLFLDAPALISADEFSELRAVIAEVIDPHRLVTEEIENFIERPAEYRGGKMPDMEGFCNIHRRIIDADLFARAQVRAAIARAFPLDPRKRLFREGFTGNLEIEIAVDRGNRFNHAVAADFARKRLRDKHGAFAQRLGKFETGQRVVAHCLIGWHGYRFFDFFCADALDDDFLRDILFIIHTVFFL